ncbi:GspE/PulE family protein [Parvularcula dongshanensis]|uniref:General secretion pathway protein E n=1 Tax=Parvularcula dongshanensis TaxID=1173995 RepID=A0A840I043_9PROT|nr:ATPase, T2SS/T4P/T4SS family [Parvularcula dongshanensis]MBB4657624.1 general secretion pathway protein E [Parvularcula dongshanensis]
MSRTERTEEATSPRRFAYGFAKDAGVVLLDGQGGAPVIGVKGDAAGVPVADPWAVIEAYRAAGGADVEVLPSGVFERRLSEVYSAEGLSSATFEDEGTEDLSALAEGLPATADLLDTEDDAPVIRLINALIAEAIKTRASDIHVEPYETALKIRMRIDGVMREVLELPARMTPVLTSRIKVMSRLDIAEKRVPQDGRISLSMGGRLIDVRVSTLPSRFGERVVMRILDQEQAKLDLDLLGMPAETLRRFRTLLKRKKGVILITGPTGSGKTTTLYSALTELKDGNDTIMTVEDPVEYVLDGIAQTQVNPKVGLTFAAGLRAILRQDPDIVLVGEVRDVETAKIAMEFSLTGHLALSTVHTNSAVGAITRLRDVGVESYLLSSTVAGIMAQRLVRKLCEACKAPREASTAELVMMGAEGPVTVYDPQGCARCNGTGYEGRIGLYELVVADEGFRQLVHDDATEAAMERHAFQHAQTLAQAGWAHAREGTTSPEEVIRVVQEVDAT